MKLQTMMLRSAGCSTRFLAFMFFEGLALVFCFVIAGFAQEPAPTSAISGTARDVNNPTNQGRAQVAAYLDAIAAQDLAKRRSAIALIRNRQAAEARQEVVRKKILSLIGGLPERTALNARTMGTVQGDGFHIEKVLFESQPQFYVTALLYIPDVRPAATRFPAILMSPGHYPTGKAADYATAADFARNGFVVLSYDPIGLGERLQYPDPHKPNASLAIRPTGEHGEAGLQPTLIGDAVSRYFVWDAIRGIDFLAQRPEVDPKRIGAFGCSGGGTISAMVGALDARVAADGVACYNTSFDALLASIGPQDGEQSIPGFVAARLDFPDWIELVAPRPYAVIATYLDMFPFSGAVATVSEARRFYSLFDPSSAGMPTGRSVEIQPTGPALNIDTANAVPLTAPFQFITGPGHHAAIGPIMGDIIAFFMRNLQPEVDASHPVLLPASNGGPNGLPKDALQVTATGQVSTSFPGCATIFTLNHQRAERIAPPLGTVSGGELVSVVRAVTGARDTWGCEAIEGIGARAKRCCRSAHRREDCSPRVSRCPAEWRASSCSRAFGAGFDTGGFADCTRQQSRVRPACSRRQCSSGDYSCAITAGHRRYEVAIAGTALFIEPEGLAGEAHAAGNEDQRRHPDCRLPGRPSGCRREQDQCDWKRPYGPGAAPCCRFGSSPDTYQRESCAEQLS